MRVAVKIEFDARCGNCKDFWFGIREGDSMCQKNFAKVRWDDLCDSWEYTVDGGSDYIEDCNPTLISTEIVEGE